MDRECAYTKKKKHNNNYNNNNNKLLILRCDGLGCSPQGKKKKNDSNIMRNK